jgi:hypothetical protein
MTIFGRFWASFGMILACSVQLLDQMWASFWKILGQLWANFWFWYDFKDDLGDEFALV